MKFMSTLRDEQLDQYSHWNKLHVAGHWTSQINCKKQNWNFLSLFFFFKTLNTKLLQVSSIPLASSNGILSPLQRISTQPPVCNTPPGLTVGQSRLGPLQSSTLCFAWDTNSVTCKTVPLAKAACPYQSQQYFLWGSLLSMRISWSENWCDTKVNRQKRDKHIPLQSLREPGQSGSSKATHRLRCTRKSLYNSWIRITNHKYGKSVVKHILNLLKVKPVYLSRHKPQ